MNTANIGSGQGKHHASAFDVVARERDALAVLDDVFGLLELRYGLCAREVVDLLGKRVRFLSVPVCVFRQGLSPLESVVKFLREEAGMRLSEIAKVLNRDQTTVWTTYHNTMRKRPERFKMVQEEFNVPVAMIGVRRLSCLEAVVVYLKEQKEITYHKIAGLLGKDDRTIWTVYSRAKKKKKQNA